MYSPLVEPDISSFHLTREDDEDSRNNVLEAAGRFACLGNPVRLKHKDGLGLIAQKQNRGWNN